MRARAREAFFVYKIKTRLLPLCVYKLALSLSPAPSLLYNTLLARRQKMNARAPADLLELAVYVLAAPREMLLLLRELTEQDTRAYSL